MNDEQILYFLRDKYHQARALEFALDNDFDPGKYLWLIGCDIWSYLEKVFTTQIVNYRSGEKVDKLFEIPVKIVVDNKDVIRLFKEV